MADAVTLADISAVAKAEQNWLKAGVIDTLRKDSWILDMLPFVPHMALKAQVLRIKSLPAVQNRSINDKYIHKVGEVEPLEEAGFLFGGKVEIDRIYDKVSPVLVTGDYASFQVDLFLKALSYQFNYDFFRNTPAANPKSITGLWSRLTNDLSAQMISAGGVDISPDSATLAASANQFLDKLGELVYACDGHSCDALFMNATTFLRVQSLLRQLGLLKITEDSFGRQVFQWGEGGPRLIDIGVKGDQTTLIFPNTETSAGLPTGGTLTSITAVKFGQEHLTGWQMEEPQTIPHQDDALSRSVTVDWYCGIAITNPRSVARLYNIQAL
jgi:hypothetical protein